MQFIFFVDDLYDTFVKPIHESYNRDTFSTICFSHNGLLIVPVYYVITLTSLLLSTFIVMSLRGRN